jgi:tetratricopeptide (TPR) repeat protein
MDVGAWLRGLGLGQYETTFRESEIDAEVLPDLTEGDLNQLGVPLGHRKRLLKAIADLGAAGTTAKPSNPAPASSTAAAERRPITVMFCDLVGSTSLVAKLDAEDWRDLVNARPSTAPICATSRASPSRSSRAASDCCKVGGIAWAPPCDFSYRLLSDVSSTATGFDELRLQAALDRLMEADLLFVDGAPPTAAYRFKHALIQDAAYESLLKSRRQALHRRAAETLCSQPERAAAAPEAIAHHFTEAGLDDLAIEWWGRAGDQALRRSAFQEAIAHLTKAIAMADRAGVTARRLTAGSAAPNQRLSQLHIAYGNAAIAARGYGALETTEAFAKARELGSGDKDAPERLAADYGLWVGSYVRGELPSMRAHAAEFLSDIKASPDSPEAGIAHRITGVTHQFAGEYAEAREQLERAFALFQPGRDDDLAIRFGHDPGIAAMLYLAIALWPLGEVERAISLVESAQARLAAITHIGTLAFGQHHSAVFELMLGDRVRAAVSAFLLARVAREYDLKLWRAFGVFLEGWAKSESGDHGGGLEDMRRGVDLLSEQNTVFFDGLLKIELADAEARTGDSDRAVAILDETLAASDRTGYRAFEAELHRARGEILLECDPANPASPAEEAFQAALAAAKRQGTRSFELRAALSLAKLYQSTGRAVDAHGVLAPALENFAPTLQMLEIVEAQALLAALAETEEVKAEADSRRQRIHLQTSYGKALIGVHGYGAPETALAFERARELATGLQVAGLDDSIDRFTATYGVWVGTHVRGELLSMRELAATFLRESASRPNSGEASVGHRIMGATHWFAAEFVEARAHLEQAVAIFDPSRDADLAFRYGQDIGVSALSYSAIALWPLGEIDLSRRRADDAVTRIRSSGHIATVAYGLALSAIYRLLIRDPEGAQPIAAQLGKAAEDLQSPQYLAFYDVFGGWPAWRSGSGESALLRIRRGIAQLKDQGIRTWAPLIEAMLAEVESEAGDSDSAMVTIARTITEAERLGQRWYDAELHRIRGEILLKQAPSVPAPAEEAFQAALAVARQQKTRSFGLRAALALAKLYQSTGSPAEAHAVLAPALEGFSPTAEMPEIAEVWRIWPAQASSSPWT